MGHAIAHQLGGLFHTPHGVANAMLLPHVLEFYLQEGGSCTQLICELAKAAKMDTTRPKTELAHSLVARIFEMNSEMQIDAEVKEMKASDVEIVARHALNEAHGSQHGLAKPLMWLLDVGYPVPRYVCFEDCCCIVAKVLPSEERKKWLGEGN